MLYFEDYLLRVANDHTQQFFMTKAKIFSPLVFNRYFLLH